LNFDIYNDLNAKNCKNIANTCTIFSKFSPAVGFFNNGTLKNFKNDLENLEKNLKIIPKIAAIPVQREIQR